MSNTVIKVENLSKSYIIGHQRSEQYLALRDVWAAQAKSFGKRLLHDLLAPVHTWSAGWLPDGSALGLGGDEGLWIYDIHTEEASLLLPGPVALPRWSRDGNRVAFTLRWPFDGIWVADSEALEPLLPHKVFQGNRPISDCPRA